MAAIGGAFLSATVQTLVQKLASPEFRDYIKNTKQLDDDILWKLQTKLLTLQAVLDDAEEKQIKNNAVKEWLDRLKDTVFDTEDLLEEIAYDSLHCKTSQVLNFFPSPFNSFYENINFQMKVLFDRLQLLSHDKDILVLKTVSGKVSHRTPSSSVVNESFMVGRADDKEKLVNMLLSERDTDSNNIGVVAIWGMGGVGKTHLAQLLYNNEKVQKHFNLKAWVCVSEDFDILKITKALLESITSKTWESNNLDILRVELKKNSRKRRFLFVLDDLWNDNYNDWDDLVSPFINGKSGSMVIITTRHQKVAEVAHTFPIHKLEPLSDKDCWSLLSHHAFRRYYVNDSKYTNLEVIGKKIARKCGGLPIASKTLGGLLRSKIDIKEWTEILNSKIWNLPNDSILPALQLSYQYLPSHLKTCFAYCSIFPKDYIFDRKHVVLLWMAEGFLEHSQGEKEAEEVGDDFFDELLARSLIQKSNNDAGGEEFVMHDLLNDLATLISGKSCARLEGGGNVSENVRYLSYNQEEYDIFKKFGNLCDSKCLRSFLPLRPSISYGRSYLSRKVVNDFLPTLKKVRVLSLSGYRNITMLPDSIGSLLHLRYLDVSWTGIKSLRDMTCNLYNLQTFILSNCQDLTELPINIGKLISLRHLDITKTNIEELPLQIVELENLRTLTIFVVGRRQVGLSIQELERFTHLQGKFTILNLHNITNAKEAHDANLKSKEQIEELALQWGPETEDTHLEGVVLDALQPSVNLKELSIDLYGGASFPSWFGDSSLTNMVSLEIHNCKYCVTLPSLGKLFSLKNLHIDGMPLLVKIGLEFYGMEEEGSDSSFQPFPSLQNLTFEDMPNWKEWVPFESSKFPFPRLITLSLFKCPELRGNLPSHLSSIEKLSIKSCDHLLDTAPAMHWLPLIKEIDIAGSDGFEETSGRNQLSLLESVSPCQLQGVSISCFRTLFSVPKMILSSTCLQHLKLSAMPSLTEFPNTGLPTSLCSLVIDKCENLSFLPPETWKNYKSLVTLKLRRSCDALTSFALYGFPALEELVIVGCNSLESIYISECCSSICPSTLRILEFYECKALRSLPQQMDTFTVLENLCLVDCPALRSLPQRIDTLTALEYLTLYRLPELELSFSQGTCLPSKLLFIRIGSVGRTTTPVTEWGLQRLTGLLHVRLDDNDTVSTLLKERLLPVSVVSLRIKKFSERKFIEGSGLRHLTSLEGLAIFNCKVLEPFLKDMFPSCLKELSIRQCPVLEAAYESERGEHWSNIAHIPVIDINDKVTI